MKITLPKWLRFVVCLFPCFFLVACLIGCGSIQQKKTETRIRHYFGLASNETLNSTNIQSALLLQFPVGTPSTMVETSLAKRGLGKDRKSTMWRQLWQANNILCCEPYDYSDGWISMRRMQVCFSLDEQQKVKEITVSSFSYSL